MLVAGVATGVQYFLDAATLATLAFTPQNLPIDIAIHHALLGTIATQVAVTALGASNVMLTPISYEVMPFFARFVAIVVAALGPTSPSLMPTILAGSAAISLAAVLAYLVAALAVRFTGGATPALPAALQAGIFATIGYGLFELTFDSLGVPPPLEMARSGSALEREHVKLWAPALALGVTLWLASRRISHPALFPCFILTVVSGTHAALLATGASLDEGRAGGWLMRPLEGRPVWALFAARDFGAIRWDVLGQADVVRELLSAALFGPIINAVLNLALIEPLVAPVLSRPLELARELVAHALGTLGGIVLGAYPAYIAISTTAIHLKSGGTNRTSCWIAIATAAAFSIFHQSMALIGYVPTLVVGATCAFIGIDFLADNLAAPTLAALTRGEFVGAASTWLCFGACMRLGMLWGVVLCAIVSALVSFIWRAEVKAKGD